MYLVLRRGAIDRLDLAGALAGSAAVACLRTFALDPAHAAAIERWRSRPGKVCLRARSDAQWDAVRAEPHVAAGNPGSGEVIALPPRRRSQRGPALEKLQAMSSALEPPARRADVRDVRRAVTYVLNPAALMSSGKSIAQIAHAAVAAADAAGGTWVADGCPGRVVAPQAPAFAAAAERAIATVVDAGLTEVPPGTITVVALEPSPAQALPAFLR
jgi:hypothetical protein